MKHLIRGIILSLIYSVDLCPEEGGGSVELIPGGRDILVNETNIYDYVRKYSEYRMLRSQEKALEVSDRRTTRKGIA